MPYSMTGFARIEQPLPQAKLVCEIRSVNHRYLEVGLRLTDACRPLETKLRELLKQSCSRGKFDIALSLSMDDALLRTNIVDESLLHSLVAMSKKINTITGQSGGLDTATLLAWPGVLRAPDQIAFETFEEAGVQLFQDTLAQLLAHRAREGKALASEIEERLRGVAVHVQTLRSDAPTYIKYLKQRLNERIAQLDTDVEEQRLAQELVLLASKADVAEELDRLDANIQETHLALSKSGPIGRRMDFLMQEFNREANTLSSKSSSSHMTQVTVELKVLIEQMREQIQNIE